MEDDQGAAAQARIRWENAPGPRPGRGPPHDARPSSRYRPPSRARPRGRAGGLCRRRRAPPPRATQRRARPGSASPASGGLPAGAVAVGDTVKLTTTIRNSGRRSGRSDVKLIVPREAGAKTGKRLVLKPDRHFGPHRKRSLNLRFTVPTALAPNGAEGRGLLGDRRLRPPPRRRLPAALPERDPPTRGQGASPSADLQARRNERRRPSSSRRSATPATTPATTRSTSPTTRRTIGSAPARGRR